MASTVWTIGHSTRTLDEFLALLAAYRIRTLADVRAFPASRRYPHFNAEQLSVSLPAHGLSYVPMKGLGGRRAARPDSINTGWRNAGFRGYADYMQTAAFQQALEELIAVAARASTAIMCAEAVPWRCHRSLIADALVARGLEVQHIISPKKTQLHTMTAFAVIDAGRVMYPSGSPPGPRLF